MNAGTPWGGSHARGTGKRQRLAAVGGPPRGGSGASREDQFLLPRRRHAAANQSLLVSLAETSILGQNRKFSDFERACYELYVLDALY